MSTIERNAWISFKRVCQNFLENYKSSNYKALVAEMIENLRLLGCNMSLKFPMMDSHLDKFPDIVGRFSKEQEERFYQDFKEVERIFQSKLNDNMMADFC